MKTIFRYIAGGLLATAAIMPAAAQELRTSYFMETSNYRHQMNPALLDAPFVGTLFSNINVGTQGNVGLSNFVYKLEGNPKYDLTTFMSPTVSADEFLGDLKYKNKINVNLNMNILSVGFNMLKGVSLVELNLRSHTNANLPKELFEFMKTTGAKEHYKLGDLGVRTQNYVEIAFGHSRNINDRLRIGAKFKYLLGAAYADLSADNLDITMNGDAWKIRGNAKLNAAVLKSTLTEDRSKPHPDIPNRYRIDELDDVTFGLPGSGFAIDLGATYKLTDDLTLSAAITDLGLISWKDTHRASSQGEWDFEGFDNIYAGENKTEDNELGQQFEDLGDELEDMFAVYNDGDGKVKQGLATTINIGADYTLPMYKKLHLGFLYTSRLNGIYSWHQGMISADVRPVKWFELAVSSGFSSTGVTFGSVLSLKAKHFNFYLGADSFIGKVSKEFIPLNNMNANINLGMTFPL